MVEWLWKGEFMIYAVLVVCTIILVSGFLME